MQSLGHSRSSHQADHLLHTPDAFVRAPLPGMKKATAIVHAVTPKFTQYTAEFEAGGELPTAETQRFVYVLEGELTASSKALRPGGFAYGGAIKAISPARAAVIEKPWVPAKGLEPPKPFTGDEAKISGQPLGGDPDLEVRSLIPADPAFDFAVNTMTFQPGAALSMVEVHVMEHGLLFLEGGGIYRLGDSWYAVTKGDFIYMAPFCPQWFGALGKAPAKYLIYKDWNR
jgi:(S)-ureidoglycine aminohydrolase